MELPVLPTSFEEFPQYLESKKTTNEVLQAVRPFKEYEAKLRQIFAQEPDHPATASTHLVPVFNEGHFGLKIRARDPKSQTVEDQEKYLLPLSADYRRANGANAVTSNLKEFQRNFSIFSESALSELDWSNVVAAGSSVVTALLPVDAPHNESKRAMRTYYHEQLAPASDVDLFLYGLNEDQAIEKIKQIETKIRDSILSETTVVRTKNAITIISEYPTRHVQIVLRLYKSVSEILTGFDVDCACVAYDGTQVWASPRAVSAFATQINEIDLTRRSPSYENRLSKYSHRGFEVYWPGLDRSRVDPTIYERAFNRVQGLARLLVLEKLPHPQDRDEYLSKRRLEKGRPELPWNARFRNQLPGNVKDAQPDDIAEWVQDDSISSYSSFTIPWGPRYSPKKIERLLFQQDILKNAEFNRPKDREANLHRHPAFFGRVEDVIGDCCGYCPRPLTDADLAAWEEESKTYVSGNISFLKDDPGRQEIGSFHPLTDEDWTEMAYIGSSVALCDAIVSKNLQAVRDWFDNTEGIADVNRRDHTGRTPLQLAVMSSSPEIVQYLIDRGARMVARLYDGMTALHLAAWRGSVEMVKSLLDKSIENEAAEEAKEETRKQARRAAAVSSADSNGNVEIPDAEADVDENDSDVEDLMDESTESGNDEDMTDSFVKVEPASEAGFEKENEDDPDVFDVDVVAWDSPCSPLHLAIIAGRLDVISLLIDKYGADVLLPVKLMTNSLPRQPDGAVLSLLLPLDLSTKFACQVQKALLDRGASPQQASMDQRTAIHHIIALAKVEYLKNCVGQIKREALSKALDRVIVRSQYWSTSADTPLLSAIKGGSLEMAREVLGLGAKPVIDLEDFVHAYNKNKDRWSRDVDEQSKLYYSKVTQPIMQAASQENMIDLIVPLLNKGADVNSLTAGSWEFVQESNRRWNSEDSSLLDVIRNHRKQLETFLSSADSEKPKMKQVDALKSDEHYLQDFPQGSYQNFSASKDLETARYIQGERNRYFAHEFHGKTEDKSSKREAVAALIRKYKAVENRLIEEGAKTFYELYPKLKESENQHPESRGKDDGESTDGIYKTRYKFFGTNVTPSQTKLYIKLFEAAWSGDIAIVKKLCLAAEDGQFPLEVGVSDHNGFNALSLAIMKGHYQLAITVLDIAALQYHNPHASQRKEYSLRVFEDTDSDEGSVMSEDDQPKFVERLITDQFTTNDTDAAQEVKSNITPLQILNENCQFWRFMISNSRDEALRRCRVQRVFDPNPYAYGSSHDEGWSKFKTIVETEDRYTRIPLSTYAVATNDTQMLKFVLENEIKYSNQDPEELLKAVNNRKDDLYHAMNLGHLEVVDLLLRARGTLLPLQHLADQSGVTLNEIPKHYQGLSVYGKKRNWANSQRFSAVSNAETGSPLLNAIMEGNLDIVDYFMSNTPARRYDEFCVHFSKDRRVRALAESKGGLSNTLDTWMGTRVNLALHVAVMSWPHGANKMLRYLLTNMPEDYLEARSVDGDTPLHLALKLGNIPAFEVLLSSGANQRTRDKKGCNLLHTIYSNAETKKKGVFSKLISLLDQSLLSKLLMERTSGAPGLQTPLALYLSQNSSHDTDFSLLDEMLTLSKGKDLTVMNGAGDYPLHVDVRQNGSARAVYFAKRRPDLLFLENATGRTPVDVATTSYLQSRMVIPQNNARQVSILEDSYETQAMEACRGDEDTEQEDDLPQGEILYSSLVRIARENPQPRRLVGLLDANETARRLAGKESRNNAEYRRRQARGLKAHRWHRYYSRNQEEEAGEASDEPARQDEVVQWFNDARSRYGRVPFCQHESSNLEEDLQRWRDLAEGKITSIRCCELADSEDRNARQGHTKMTDNINEIWQY